MNELKYVCPVVAALFPLALCIVGCENGFDSTNRGSKKEETYNSPECRTQHERMRVVDARLKQIVEAAELSDPDKWRDFVGIFKYEVTNPLESRIERHTQLNVVIPRNIERVGFTGMHKSIKAYSIGDIHRLTLTESPWGSSDD